MKRLWLSVIILTISVAGQAEAIELLPHMSAPSVEQPPVAPNTEQPAPVNAAVEIGLVIKLSERRVYVYRGDRIEKSFPIAIGRRGWETPTGKFKVLHMERDPIWEHPLNGQVIPPGPNNPLGARWIGFWTDGRNYIGFHGTPNERLVGQAVSHGCIRMRNRDIEALYEMVKVGTPVTVEP
ncbi:MAG TPA: L,D-transpeptidase [Cyanobacteria bacterium UBA11372]|nr:L,D-transpeptidase [Cyanobacteria bacterium UBA11372]